MKETQGSVSVRKFFKHKSIWTALYAVYFSMVLLSVYAFIAEDSVDNVIDGMDEKYDYTLVFNHDGKTTHYDVTRHTTSLPGKITLTYWTSENKLDVTEVSNIKNLTIDVEAMFDDEIENVFKSTQAEIPTMDLNYWLEAGDGLFTVEFDIDDSEPLQSLKFTKFPSPQSVLVDHQNIDVVALQKPEALLDRPCQRVAVLCIEGLRPSPQLRGQDQGRVDVLQYVSKHLLAVEIPWRSVGVVHTKLDRAPDGCAGLLEWAAVLGDEQPAHAEPADSYSRASQCPKIHAHLLCPCPPIRGSASDCIARAAALACSG